MQRLLRFVYHPHTPTHEHGTNPTPPDTLAGSAAESDLRPASPGTCSTGQHSIYFTSRPVAVPWAQINEPSTGRDLPVSVAQPNDLELDADTQTRELLSATLGPC